MPLQLAVRTGRQCPVANEKEPRERGSFSCIKELRAESLQRGLDLFASSGGAAEYHAELAAAEHTLGLALELADALAGDPELFA